MNSFPTDEGRMKKNKDEEATVRWRWTPGKIVALVLFILAIACWFLGVWSYSTGGAGSWCWLLLITSVVLFSLALFISPLIPTSE